MSEFTRILESVEKGDPHAGERLLPLVYDELRRLASSKMARQIPGQTLQPTALVHEAWLKLSHQPDASWENRTHFFRAAAQAMRSILIDQARKKQRVRHGGQLRRVNLSGLDLATNASADANLAVDEALNRFAVIAPEKADLVKLRFYIGLTNEEAAKTLGISLATAKRHWAYSRAWLLDAILKDR